MTTFPEVLQALYRNPTCGPAMADWFDENGMPTLADWLRGAVGWEPDAGRRFLWYFVSDCVNRFPKEHREQWSAYLEMVNRLTGGKSDDEMSRTVPALAGWIPHTTFPGSPLVYFVARKHFPADRSAIWNCACGACGEFIPMRSYLFALKAEGWRCPGLMISVVRYYGVCNSCSAHRADCHRISETPDVGDVKVEWVN